MLLLASLLHSRLDLDRISMIRIKIPIKLGNEANSREHWAKKSKRHKQQKMLVRAYMARYSGYPLPCIVTLKRFSPRSFDSDNLQTAFKYIRDAVSEYVTETKQAGMADSDPRISWEYCQEKTNEKEHYIIIQISAV